MYVELYRSTKFMLTTLFSVKQCVDPPPIEEDNMKRANYTSTIGSIVMYWCDPGFNLGGTDISISSKCHQEFGPPTWSKSTVDSCQGQLSIMLFLDRVIL